MRKTDLQVLYTTLFPFELQKDEYVEVIYDNGDKVFKHAVHVESVWELLGIAEEYDGKVNFAICSNTRKVKRSGRRTGRDAITRQKAVLIDIEDPNKHVLRDPNEVRSTLIADVVKNLPAEVRSAIKWSAYTGGGALMCVELDRIAEGGEIEIVYEYLRRKLKDVPYIDHKSFNSAQALRLIGTANVKYSKPVDTYIYNVNPDCEPLRVDEMVALSNAEQDIEHRSVYNIEKYGGYIKNLESVVKEIKRRVRVKDLSHEEKLRLGEGSEYAHYTTYLCPFHPENNPSFVVYHNEDADIAIDFHDNEYYDVISLYQKVHGASFAQAVKELAKKGGVKLAFTRGGKKELESEEALQAFDANEYIYEELRIRKVEYWIDDEGYQYEITVESVEGDEVSFSVPRIKLSSYKVARGIFDQYTGKRPKKLPKGVEEEGWDLVLEEIKKLGARITVGSAFQEKLDTLRDIIVSAGSIEDDLNEYIGDEHHLKFYDVDRNKVYVSLPKLMNELRDSHSLFSNISVKELQKLLRKLGAKSVRYGKKAVRLWELPDYDWRVNIVGFNPTEADTTKQADTWLTPQKKDGVSPQSVETQALDKKADTTDTKISEFFVDENKNSEKVVSVVSAKPESVDRQGLEGRHQEDVDGVSGVSAVSHSEGENINNFEPLYTEEEEGEDWDIGDLPF